MKAVQVKICGITRPGDAEVALSEGAGHLGFILHEKSPRCVTLSQAQSLFDEARVPEEKRVAVAVDPEVDCLGRWKAGGFSDFQLHFPYDLARDRIAEWAELVGPGNLLLAPQLPPGESFPEDLLGLADSFLIDAFSADAYGGTGKTSDWAGFAEWQSKWPDKEWILAGGLSPENVTEAVAVSGAVRVDANSGVESAPGIKDSLKVRAFFACLRAT